MLQTAERRHRRAVPAAAASFDAGRVPAEPGRIPVLPPPAARLLGAVPAVAIQWLLQHMVASVARRHPALFERLGDHASATFLIDPTDLPFAFRLRPRADMPSVEVVRRRTPRPWDARIAGPLAALLGMVHGTLDGDALFFSRDLSVEGDTEAILALRNAIDDAEIDLPAEAAAALGPLGTMLDGPCRVALSWVERLTGVALSRGGHAA